MVICPDTELSKSLNHFSRAAGCFDEGVVNESGAQY